jgi:glutathione S-transferase
MDRMLAASPMRVWHALTDPDALTRWFWPAALHPVAEVDLRPGGKLRIEAPGQMAVEGEFLRIDEPRVLEFTWCWDGEDLVTTVRVELSAVDGGTRLVLHHGGFPDDGQRDSHATGWSDCLARLPGYLSD